MSNKSSVLQLASKHLALITPTAEGKLLATVVTTSSKTAQLKIDEDVITVDYDPSQSDNPDIGSNSVLEYSSTGKFISVDNAKMVAKKQSKESMKSPRSPIWTRPNY